MLATLLIFAQEAAEEEPSKVPFYILGGVAAAWAICLFAVGMRSPSFPGSIGAQRAVMAISVVLVAAAMTSAVLTA
jgi:mannitol-specific phosphotransferase system IIBC component